jgi:hypothetical protein
MEFRFFLEEWIPGPTAAMVEALVVLLIVGVWLRALLVAASGRGALNALLALTAIGILIGIYDMQYVLNTPMPWPEQIMVGVMMLASIAAAVVVLRYRSRMKKLS